MTGVPAVRAGIAILRRLAEHGRPMSAALLAHELGLPSSTTYHLLAEMRDSGVIEHHRESKKWALGPLVAELGEGYRRTHPTAEDLPAGDEPAGPSTTRSTTPS